MAPDVSVAVLDHPVVQDRLRYLRDEGTSNEAFRALTDQLASFVAYEALRDAALRDVRIPTPVVPDAPGRVLDERYLVVPILRAGLGMLAAVQGVLPESRACLVGVRRDEETLQPELYHDGVPAQLDGVHAIVCDPMLATGGSAALVVDLLASRGAVRITILCLVACALGIERLARGQVAVEVVTAALDERLNEVGYIVPGLGDAGDRLYGAR